MAIILPARSFSLEIQSVLRYSRVGLHGMPKHDLPYSLIS